MPTRYRTLAKELTETDDLAHIISIANTLMADTAERVSKALERLPETDRVRFDTRFSWYLRDKQDLIYERVVGTRSMGASYEWKIDNNKWIKAPNADAVDTIVFKD